MLASLRRIHQQVGLALWAALTVFVALFLTTAAPAWQNTVGRYQTARAQEIEHENDVYCRRWHFSIGTPDYAHCMSDLTIFRAAVERRLADDSDF